MASIDLSTNYLGLHLKNPLVASASPLSKSVDLVRRLEDAGASAIVMYSLFEEQITHESLELDYFLQRGTEVFSEALSYFPDMDHYNMGTEPYVDHVHAVKQAVNIPVIEVHLSNPFAREQFRHHSFVSPAAKGLICGFGAHSYVLAIDALAGVLRSAKA